MKRYYLAIAVLLSMMCSSCVSFCPKEIIYPPLRGTELGPAVLSPDNQTIVFSVLSKSGSRLYTVRRDGTGFRPITSEQTQAYDPAFSRNGTKILFTQVSNGNGDICEINSDGSEKICLTSGPDHDYSPVYSPDGNKIYFLRAKTFTNYSPIALPAWHNVDIYSMNADGTAIEKMTSERSYGMSTLSISPQSEALLVMGSAKDDAIWIIPLADPTSKKSVRPNLDKYRKKTFWGYEDIEYQSLRNPQFSPDGDKILFSWPYNEELYVMDRKTNMAEQIWKYDSKERRWPSRMYPRFSNDGKQLIFSTATTVKVSICDTDRTWKDSFDSRREMPELWIINADGTGLQSVVVKSEGRK